MIPIFTRLLTPSDYGVVSLYQTWLSVLTIIISFNLSTSIGRAKYDFQGKFNEFSSSISFLSLILFLFFCFIFFVFDSIFIAIINLPKKLIIFLFCQSYFQFCTNLIYAKCRFEYKYKVISILIIFNIIVGAILSILLIFLFENKFFGPIIGKGVLIIINGIVFVIYLLYKGKKFVNIKYWKYALIISVPLMFHSLSLIINSQFDRILLTKYLGNSATGIYSFGYNVSLIFIVFFHAINKAWVPWFFEQMKEEKFSLIYKKAEIFRDFFSGLYLFIIFFSPFIIKVIASDTYWKALNIMPWILLGTYFQILYTFEVSIEHFYKKTKYIAIGTIVSAFINICLNIIFIPKFGYIGAAFTTTISYFFLFIFHFINVKYVLQKKVYDGNFYLTAFGQVFFINFIYFSFPRNKVVSIFMLLMFFLLYYRKKVFNFFEN